MNESIKAVCNERREGAKSIQFGKESAERVRAYHKSFPEYSATPLMQLRNLARELGVENVYVKDESYRFGLNAFKGLGGSYCLGRYISERLGHEILSYDELMSPEVRERVGEITFVTATDGNHGRGIAWAAQKLGHRAVVYMPKGSVAERLNNIRKLGAEASITELNYDDTVKFAYECEKKYGWVLVQDTAWEGYEKIPGWIMQGYLTMAMEIVEQLDGAVPTHIFLQAGVGALAGALAGFFGDCYGKDKPIITIVEPNKADCIYRTARANDGTLHSVTGSMSTIMAGLACGVPCTIAWDVLKIYAENFVSMPDYVAAKGMRILGNPLGDDMRVISGESGASTTGFFAELMQNESLDYLREQMKIDRNSIVLCISTEGDTDKSNYRRIVWDGLNPSF